MKLLVIEDDAQTASFVARGLQQAGHTVDQAPDGDLCIAAAHAAAPIRMKLSAPVT